MSDAVFGTMRAPREAQPDDHCGRTMSEGLRRLREEPRPVHWQGRPGPRAAAVVALRSPEHLRAKQGLACTMPRSRTASVQYRSAVRGGPCQVGNIGPGLGGGSPSEPVLSYWTSPRGPTT